MAETWLERAAEAGRDCPLRMEAEGPGSLRCDRCGREIVEGELFFLRGHCAMGGLVEAPHPAYADVLEPRAAHLRCEPTSEREGGCFTLGHGARPFGEFLAILREAEVQVVADIRTVPRSRRNPQYARETLAPALREAGLCYLHLPELGGLRHPRRDSPNTGWRNESFRGYADYMLTPAFEAALEELLALCRHRRTALVCAESVYWRCHRCLVADALLLRGIVARHLMGRGRSEPHRLTAFARPQGTRLLYPAPAEPAAGEE